MSSRARSGDGFGTVGGERAESACEAGLTVSGDRLTRAAAREYGERGAAAGADGEVEEGSDPSDDED